MFNTLNAEKTKRSAERALAKIVRDKEFEIASAQHGLKSALDALSGPMGREGSCEWVLTYVLENLVAVSGRQVAKRVVEDAFNHIVPSERF